MKKILAFLLFYFCTLLPSAYAATYYVATTGGDNSRNCTQAQSIGTPLQTMTVFWTKCAASIVAGDTVNIRSGTYSEPLLSNADQTVPSGGGGSDWGSNAVTIQAYSNETVTFTGTFGRCITFNGGSVVAHYYIFRGIIFDGCAFGANTTTVHHIKLENMEIKNVNAQCLDYYGSYLWVTGSRIHDCIGSTALPTQTHAIYVEGPNALVEHNELYNVPYGYGIHNYGDNGQAALSNGVYRSNYIHHIGVGNTLAGVGCMVLSEGADIQAYNNICAHSMGGITTFRSPPRVRILNNTFYDIGSNIGSGCSANGCTVIDASGSDPRVQNNLIWTTQVDTVISTAGASGTIINSNNTTTDPHFQNAAAGQFQLTSASTGQINQGADLSAFLTTDYANTSRSLPYDIGAYEFGGASSCPSVPNALVASYDFENNGNDSTGNGRTATLGSGWTYTASGHLGQGALSNGTSGITVADHDSLDPCAAFTYEGWINLPNTTGDYVFINKNPDSKAFLFASIYGYCGSGVPIGGYSDVTSPFACSTTALTPGFKHLAVTYDSTLTSANVKLYVNGIAVASANGTTLLGSTTGTLQFCTSNFGETCPSGTVIDQVRIYNYARSASEILSSVTAPVVFTIKLQVSSIKIGPSVNLKVGVP